MRVLIAPDKFKGTLSAPEVCEAIEAGLKEVRPSIETVKLPLADGGEGTLDILRLSLGLEKVMVNVHDPLFRPIPSYYCFKENSAFIEMAVASGLQLLQPGERNAGQTTTLGTGELILDAINRGATRIYLFIGGSATNDGGTGMAHALGYRFYNKDGDSLLPIGANLKAISKIDPSGKANLSGITFIVATDVKNLLYGTDGAAHVYGPQKGATKQEVRELDEGLRNLGRLFELYFGKDISGVRGAGAAGGLGAGALAFLNARIQSGIDTIIEIVGLEDQLRKADLVITGEGKFDRQTLEGKVIQGVVELSAKHNVPVGVICGLSEIDPSAKKIKYLYPLVNEQVSAEEALANSYALVKKRAAELIGRHLKIF